MRLIDADGLITILIDRDYIKTSRQEDNARELLNFAPTVEERKKGKWESFIRCFQTADHSVDSQRLFECSVCRYNTNITTKFCPNCGADMRGGTDGGDNI